MKRSNAVVCLFFVMGVPASLTAQMPGSTGPIERTVTVNFTQAVLQTAEGRREFGALQTKYGPRQTELQSLNREVESLRKQLGSDGSKLADADRQSREKTLDDKDKQLQRQAEDFRNDSQADSQQVYQRIAQKMYVFLQGYAQRHNFAMVIDRGSDATPIVWYAAKGVDVTDDLIKAYDESAATTGSHLDQAPSAQKPDKSLPPAPSPH
jgi:outer membrane protein